MVAVLRQCLPLFLAAVVIPILAATQPEVVGSVVVEFMAAMREVFQVVLGVPVQRVMQETLALPERPETLLPGFVKHSPAGMPVMAARPVMVGLVVLGAAEEFLVLEIPMRLLAVVSVCVACLRGLILPR